MNSNCRGKRCLWLAAQGPASKALPGGGGRPSPASQDEWGQFCTYWLAPARDRSPGIV